MALRAVAAGGTYLDPAIAGMVVGRAEPSGIARNSNGTTELSTREAEVLQLAAAGYTNKELSLRLRVGVKTIETYKARAMEKLGLDARAELVRYATTTIALTSDERRLIVVNREANSISVIQVKDANGNDVAQKLKEISVGQEPRCVAVHPGDRAAYVTNGVSGTVSSSIWCRAEKSGKSLWAPNRAAAP